MLENDCEDIHGISNVKCSFEPYQGEPLTMASDEEPEPSEDEADKDQGRRNDKWARGANSRQRALLLISIFFPTVRLP